MVHTSKKSSFYFAEIPISRVGLERNSREVGGITVYKKVLENGQKRAQRVKNQNIEKKPRDIVCAQWIDIFPKFHPKIPKIKKTATQKHANGGDLYALLKNASQKGNLLTSLVG